MVEASSSAPPGRGSWWVRRSLRARLTAATTVVLAVGMTLAAVLLVWQVHRSLIAGLDAAVTQQVQAVAAQAEHGQLPRTLPDADGGTPAVQVITVGGRVIAASAGLERTAPMFTFHGGDDPVLASVTTTNSDGDGNGSYRAAALNITDGNLSVTVYAALPTDPVDDTTAELVAALAVGVPAIVIVLALVAWLLLGRALRPVEAMRLQAAAIPATDLHRRLRTPPARDELSRLADTLNNLLARIETATDRQRQFIADAAHELRSPIASLRAQLEITGRHPDPATASTRATGMLAEVERLTNLVDDLLALARLDASPEPHRRIVDLDDLVLQPARAARGRGPTIDASAVSAGRVLGDPGGLARVVRNLLDNAVRYAGSRVALTLRGDDTTVTLIVADDGPGIAPADRKRVFERFTRLDDARSRDAGGAGLGLAIVHDVVTSHHGTIRIEDNHPGARFTIALPAAE